MYICYVVAICLLCFLTAASSRHVSPRCEEQGRKARTTHEEDKNNNSREEQWSESEADWRAVVATFEKHRKLKWPVKTEEWRRLLRRLYRHGKLNDVELVNKEPEEVVCWYDGSILKVGERLNGGSCVCEETGFLACP